MRDNAQSWVAKVIVGVIVLIFALTGWESISRFTSDDQNAAEVNGTAISKAELEQAVSLQRRQLIQQMQQIGNDSFDPNTIDDRLLRESVLEGLIERALLTTGAADARLRISEQMIDQLILATPDFQSDGQFDANRFDIVIRNMGLGSRMAFRDLVRQELMIAQLRNGFEATAFATPGERDLLASLESQTRDFAVLELPMAEKDIAISEAEVSEYYNANLPRFMTPEQVVLETLTLSRSDFFDQVEVDEAALEAIYQREIGNLAEQRRSAHILIESSDPEDDAQALERAEQIRQRIEQGEDFADLARELSDDPGSANRGGDLGFSTRDSVDPAFEQALFALELGQVSEPVRSTYGYHLIKLTDLRAPEIPSLESMRASLEEELKAEQVERRFVEASQELANLAYEAIDLEDPARALGLEVQTHEPVERSGGEGLTANPRLIAAAFDDEVLLDGRNSPLLELDADTVVVVRVKEHLRPQQRTEEQVAAEIVELLQHNKATAQAEARADELVASLRTGETTTAELADSLEKNWEEHEAISRSNRDVLPALLRNVFSMPKPASDKPVYAHFRQTDGGQWLVELRGVATPETVDSSAPIYQQFIAGQTGEQDFVAVQEQLREEADIERF